MENKEIRRANLLALAEEHGTLKALADATGTDPAHLSQIKNGTREMGEDVARRIETKLGKRRGWMDAVQGDGDDAERQQLLADYGVASPEWKLTLRLLAKLPAEQQPEIAATLNKVLANAPGISYTRKPLYNSRHEGEQQEIKDKKRRTT